MTDERRNNDWQVLGAIALIVLGAVLFMDRIGLPWWNVVRQAFHFAFDVAWPIAFIAIGVLLLTTARRRSATATHSGKRLYRSRHDRMVGGVLSGVADYIGIDPTWVRIVYVVLAIFSGFWLAVLVYIVAMIVVPEEPLAAPANPWPGSGTPAGAQPTWAQPPADSHETVQTPPAPPVPPVVPRD